MPCGVGSDTKVFDHGQLESKECERCEMRNNFGGLQGLETGVNEVVEAENIVHNYKNQVPSWPSPIFLPPGSAVQLAPCCVFV